MRNEYVKHPGMIIPCASLLTHYPNKKKEKKMKTMIKNLSIHLTMVILHINGKKSVADPGKSIRGGANFEIFSFR